MVDNPPLPYDAEHGSIFDLGPKGTDPSTDYSQDERWQFLLGTLSVPTIGEGDTLGYLMENDKFITGTPALQWTSRVPRTRDNRSRSNGSYTPVCRHKLQCN